jgi:catechol 2,3-dioxygenase-like lactoylglutathione lyase family enzyme
LEIEIMNNPRINGVRSVELGVHDLQKSLEFYRNVWALEEVAGEGDTVHLRGTGQEHHVVTLRERPRAALLGVHFSAADRATVDALHAKAKAIGANVENAPGQLTADAGGGYGFQLRTPEGHPLSISSDVARHGAAIDDRARPTKLTHVVLNSAEVEKQTAFFLDVLGFKWSDSTFMMDFVRCCSDHHSVAFARGNGPSLNHMAYEMPNIDGLMRGAGRLRNNGYEIMWGVGRHGPGSNVFSYFVEPNGFVTEYTTEVDQVDDNYVGHDAKWWKEQNVFPCRWNMAGVPSELTRKAMSGALYEEENQRCEQVMAKALGR